MSNIIREKHHRLPPEAYRGAITCAFTVCTAERNPFFKDSAVVEIAVTALTEAFAQHRGRVGGLMKRNEL